MTMAVQRRASERERMQRGGNSTVSVQHGRHMRDLASRRGPVRTLCHSERDMTAGTGRVGEHDFSAGVHCGTPLSNTSAYTSEMRLPSINHSPPARGVKAVRRPIAQPTSPRRLRMFPLVALTEIT